MDRRRTRLGSIEASFMQYFEQDVLRWSFFRLAREKWRNSLEGGA